jgi:hypothetical protein
VLWPWRQRTARSGCPTPSLDIAEKAIKLNAFNIVKNAVRKRQAEMHQARYSSVFFDLVKQVRLG